jgi:hypothetical protein
VKYLSMTDFSASNTCESQVEKLIAEQKFVNLTNLFELFICVYKTIDIELRGFCRNDNICDRFQYVVP